MSDPPNTQAKQPHPPGLAIRARARVSVADQPWVDELVEHIDAGKPIFVAAGLLGMSYKTIHRAAQRDPEFAAKLRAAESRRREATWNKLDTQPEQYPGEWKKWAWQLERTTPELREVKEVRQQVDDAITSILDQLEGLMSPEAYGELLDAMAELERQSAVAPPEAAPASLGDG